jgi:ribosomal protein S18 acetylase RimI-like enzyme
MEEDIRHQILETLKSSPSGLQTEELTKILNLTRHTVAKYLEVLRAGGKIHYVKIGRTKLWKVMSTVVNTRMLDMEDLDSILAIEEKIEAAGSSAVPESLDHLKESAAYHIEQGDPLMNLGAEVDGRLVGFVLAETRHWEFGRAEKAGWINMLGVDPEYQGMGIGRKLGEALLSNFQRKRITKVRTLVNWYNGELISYFKTLGFDILNMIPLEKDLDENGKVQKGI